MTQSEKSQKKPAVPGYSPQDFEQYTDSLYAFARKRVQSDDDILDLVQDTLLDFLEQQNKFREQSTPLTYLTAILRNKIFHLYRKQSRELSVPGEDLTVMIQTRAESAAPAHKASVSEAERTTDAEATLQIIYSCIHRLKSPYFEAFVMREIEELSTEEICKILSVTVTNLNVILHRARQKLMQMLKGEGIENVY